MLPDAIETGMIIIISSSFLTFLYTNNRNIEVFSTLIFYVPHIGTLTQLKTSPDLWLEEFKGLLQKKGRTLKYSIRRPIELFSTRENLTAEQGNEHRISSS